MDVDGGYLGANAENPSAGIVLGEIFGEAEDGGAGEAALEVEHEAFDGRVET